MGPTQNQIEFTKRKNYRYTKTPNLKILIIIVPGKTGGIGSQKIAPPTEADSRWQVCSYWWGMRGCIWLGFSWGCVGDSSVCGMVCGLEMGGRADW